MLSDDAVRQSALDTSKSFIIQAPAGSGKTELLIQRLFSLLARVNVPEEVLALTFTNKAASEMQRRIVDILRKQEQPVDNPSKILTWQLAQKVKILDQKLSWNLSNNPNRIRIQTIDSFCFYMVKRMPVLSQAGCVSNLASYPSILYKNAVFTFMRNIQTDNKINNELSILLRHIDLDTHKLQNLLVTLLACRDQWLSWIVEYNQLEPLTAKLKAQQVITTVVFNELSFITQLLPQDIKDDLVTIAAIAAQYLVAQNALDNPISACFDLESFPQISIDACKYWVALAFLLLDSSGCLRKSVSKNQGFPAPSSAVNATEKASLLQHKTNMLHLLERIGKYKFFYAQLIQLKILPDFIYSPSQWNILDALFKVLPHLVAQLIVEFSRTNTVDYIYISQAAVYALQDEQNLDLHLYLENKISHLLVDEFQDISTGQFMLFQRLTVDWVECEKSIFFVGDPMQSIYRFRQANVGLFLHVWSKGLGGNIPLTPLQLTSNFRSSPSLVAWINNTFAYQLPPQADINKGAVTYTASQAQCDHVDGECGVNWYFNNPQGGSDISQMVVQQLIILRQQYPQDTIAVLVRSRSHLSSLVPALLRKRIPFNAAQLEPLAAKPLVQDLLSLTKAVYHLGDRIAWLAILRAPWCGLILDDLYVLASDSEILVIDAIQMVVAGELVISPDGYARLEPVAAILNYIVAQKELDVSSKVEKLWHLLEGDSLLSVDIDKESVQLFFNLLSSCKNDVGLLEDKLATSFADVASELDTSVNLMTIHKAKGLEFDHVLLTHLDSASRANIDELMLWEQCLDHKGKLDMLFVALAEITAINPLYNFVKLRNKFRDSYERVRLLYVAVTRAKKTLHLFANVTQAENKMWKTPQQNSFLYDLWKFCQESLSKFSLETIYMQPNANYISTLKRRIEPLVFANTKMKAVAAECQFMPWIDNSDRAVGILFHAIAAQLAQCNLLLTWKADREYLAHVLTTMAVVPDKISASVNVVMEAVEKMLGDDKGRWLLDNNHRSSVCEWSVSGVINNHIHHKVIDRSFVDSDDVRWIVDYKLVANYSDQDNFLQQQYLYYRAQLETYATLLHCEGREIKLVLYFPLLQDWYKWSFKPSDR